MNATRTLRPDTNTVPPVKVHAQILGIVWLITSTPSFGGNISGDGDLFAQLTIGGEGGTPSVTVTENYGIHPNAKTGTVVFTLMTKSGGTRQGVKIDNVCPPAGCAVKATWSLQLDASATTTDDDGYTYAETGPTTYKALLQSTGPIEPGQYTVKIETLWIY